MAVAAKKRPVTLKAVAAQAKCSVSSVSTVLNNARGNSVVGDAMRQRILQIAGEMGYRPNFASRSLKTRRSQTLGLYVQPKRWRSIGNTYEMPIFKGVEQAARERNYDVMVLNMGTQVLPAVCEEHLAEGRIDGIVLIHADWNAEWVNELSRTSDCVVAVDCCGGNTNVSRVLFDEPAAIRMALEYLAGLGHRRIGYAGGCTTEKMEVLPREQAFINSVAHLGLDTDPDLVFNETKCFPPISAEERYCQAEGEAAMRYFHSLAEPPTAVIANNSLVGLLMMREAQRLGVRVPEEMSLLGIDDFEYLHYTDPELTVIDHRLEEMGRCGADLLIDLIEHRVESPAYRMFAPKLIKGTSCVQLQH